ncbi:hypothetical protein K443DRAFT_435163, partial [Laccaria amethystina LaAM-08-1]
SALSSLLPPPRRSPIHPLHTPHPTLRTSSRSLTPSHQTKRARLGSQSHTRQNPKSQHPRGDEVLLAEGGQDATGAFEDVGLSDEGPQTPPFHAHW